MNNHNKTYRAVVLILFLSFACAVPALGAAKTSTGSGNWNTSGTWTPSGVPGAGDTVVIAAGHNVTLNTNGTCGALNVIGTLTYDATAGRTMTITTSSGQTGNLTLSGTYTSGGTTGQIAYVAGSLSSTGTINNSAPGVNSLKWQFNGTGITDYFHYRYFR